MVKFMLVINQILIRPYVDRSTGN